MCASHLRSRLALIRRTGRVRPSLRLVSKRPVHNTPGAPFNGSPDFGNVVEKYMKDYNINTVIETGTFHGSSTLFFAQKVAEVHTIEILPETFESNKRTFAQKPVIHAHLGNSPEILSRLLQNWPREKRILFYLDAHWGDYWPLNDELTKISQSSARDNCLIIIDDFQIPARPDVPYDVYKGQPLNLSFVMNNLQLALPNLCYEYYAPPLTHPHSRGRLIAFPSLWKE